MSTLELEETVAGRECNETGAMQRERERDL